MLHSGAGSAARYMMVPSRDDLTLTASATGKGTSSLVAPPPRPKNDGTPGVTVKPSVDWIVYVLRSGVLPHCSEIRLLHKRIARLFVGWGLRVEIVVRSLFAVSILLLLFSSSLSLCLLCLRCLLCLLCLLCSYGKYSGRRQKKLHTTRAAALRMQLRQVVRVWHLYVESTRLCRQRNITALMVSGQCSTCQW